MGGQARMRRLAHRVVPSHFGDPLGLAYRVLRHGGADGRFAVFLAGLGIVTLPLDLAMARRERRRLDGGPEPELPIVFVCGPARSGTTVVAQSLIRATDVGYITNLTALFPRSPLTASRILRTRPSGRSARLRSHYGRTAGFGAPNDGLHLWDRWIGADRTAVYDELQDAPAMAKFFGGLQAWLTRPIVTKNNALNAHAHLVAEALPTARFLCVRRDPLWLGQSLYAAREYIHGSAEMPYGIHDPALTRTGDPIADIRDQIRYHERVAATQSERLGPDLFRVVDYDDFCADPRSVIKTVAADWLHTDVDLTNVPDALVASRSRRLPSDVFDRLESALAEG